MTKEILGNLLRVIETITVDDFKKLNVSALEVLIKSISQTKIKLNEGQASKLRAWILYSIGTIKWPELYNLLLKFDNKEVCVKILDKEIELKLSRVLVYSLKQVNLTFFMQLA